MATSNIKLFDENKVNMMPDEAYQVETQRMQGVQSGIASSQLQNKTLYQLSLVSYAIAQIMNQNGLDANDSDAVSTFVNNLSSTMLQKVYDIATTAEAQGGIATGKWMSPALVKSAIDALAAKAQNILSDGTKVLLGGDSSMVPDEAFVALKTLGDIGASAAQIKSGTYAGTGRASFNLNLGGPPKFLVICPNKFYFPEHQDDASLTLALYAGQPEQQLLRSNSRYVNPTYVEFTPSATGITVRGYGYNPNNNNALITDNTMNKSGVTYYYLALL